MSAGMSKPDRTEFHRHADVKLLEATRKRLRDQKVPCDFDTLEDVLKSIRDYPKI